MNMDIPTLLGASAGAMTALSGIYAAGRHIRYNLQAKKDRERQEILKKAEEELNKVQAELEKKISVLKQEFEAHKVGLSKDLDFMRSTYNAEIRQLGEKIEALREDLGAQHSQMVSLLTQLVSKS